MGKIYRNGTTITPTRSIKEVSDLTRVLIDGITTLVNVTIPEGLTKIRTKAFNNITSISGKLTIPSSVTLIEDYAFSGCSNLSGNLDLSHVQTLGSYAFMNTGIVNAKIKISAKIGSYCFDSCKSLNISEVNADIGDYAFRDCSGITGDIIVNQQYYSSSGHFACFIGCSGITRLKFSTGRGMGNSLFRNCSSLSEADIYCEVVSSYVFDGCSSLRIVNYTPSRTSASINGYAFRNSSLNDFTVQGRGTVSLATTSFAGTPIESGTGHIYFDSSKLQSYMTATNWVTFAAQMFGFKNFTADEILDNVATGSFTTTTWFQTKDDAIAGINGVIADGTAKATSTGTWYCKLS